MFNKSMYGATCGLISIMFVFFCVICNAFFFYNQESSFDVHLYRDLDLPNVYLLNFSRLFLLHLIFFCKPIKKLKSTLFCPFYFRC